MNFFTAIDKWFWAAAIGITCLNAVIFHVRAKRLIREHPDLADGYTAIVRGTLIWGNIPWIIMGIGCLVGGVPSASHFIHPEDGNPFVLAFDGSIFLLWCLGTFWLFFRGGAEMLVKHPGLLSTDFGSPRSVKLFWLLCLAGVILGIGLTYIMDIP